MKYGSPMIIVVIFLASCSGSRNLDTIKIPETVSAENPLHFDGKVSFRDIEEIKPQIVSECEIENNITASIVDQSRENGLPISTSSHDRELVVEILRATPGAIYFGNLGGVPATLGVYFKVIEGDEIIYEENKSCRTKLAGFLGLQPSACNKLEKCARNHGKYISERIYRKLYK